MDEGLKQVSSATGQRVRTSIHMQTKYTRNDTSHMHLSCYIRDKFKMLMDYKIM